MTSFRTIFLPTLAVLFALASGAPPADAQPSADRWTPELAMQYDQITDTQISPDGKQVAYVVREAVIGETTSEFRQHIYVAAANGSSDVQYTRGEHSNFSPKWSPSGDRIAFLSTRGEGPPQVYLMRVGGGEAYRITDAETGVSGFGWGPDGEHIAYTMTDPKSDAEKQREREKRDVTVVGDEPRHDHLYTTAVKPVGDPARTVQRLTEGEFHVWSFDWAPDGETIAFAHQPSTHFAGRLRRDISTVPADSGAVAVLIDRPGYDGSPQYSPDGKTVAFESTGPPDEGAPRLFTADIHSVSAGGGRPERLALTPDQNADLIGWTSGSEALLVREDAKTSHHVYAVPANGDSVTQVTSGEGVYGSPSHSSLSEQLALTYQNSNTPAEVYVGSTDDFSRTQLTSVHVGVPRPEMGRTELVTWTGPGGEEIEALLTYPVGYTGGEVPLVLDIHGGPTAAHLRGFTGSRGHFPVQVFTERGYAVLRPNPRGSTGYGRAFRSVALRGKWGTPPFKDLMAGVDKAVDMGVGHPDSLVVMGGSYGGYMTAFAVTQTDRFGAASMIAGVSNLISQIGTAHGPRDFSEAQWGKLWENYETYEQQSPIYHAAAVTTPTQVLHGTEDEVVPPSQGREFYSVLKWQSVPTEMVLYPRTPHGAREPKLMMDHAPRMIEWFDRHLGRASGE